MAKVPGELWEYPMRPGNITLKDTQPARLIAFYAVREQVSLTAGYAKLRNSLV
jgi:hypothetical protein